MELKLLKFIEENNNWKEILQEKPYRITIKEDDKYILFMYSQIDSDFSLDVVKECRGIIFRKFDMKPVCVPFYKFFNIQENLASYINWNTVQVQQKIDGSLIKIWYDNEWHISTSGTTDARNAPLAETALIMDNCKFSNYAELFVSVFPQKLFYDTLQTNKTYMFEIVSPFNRVVIPYSETKIYHVGTRNNDTLEESDDDINIEKPQTYRLNTATQCLQAVQDLPFSDEGYVVVDNHWNRVKIKSSAYVAAHHLKNNGVITMSRIVDVIRLNAQEDFVAIYPEYTEVITKVQNAICDFIHTVEKDWAKVVKHTFETRKDLALFVNKMKCPSVIYCLCDNKASDSLEWLYAQTNEKLLKWIGVE